MQSHYLKTVQPYFDEVWLGKKTFEVRVDDRKFEVGDTIYLQEYDKDSNTYSGRELRGTITYILSDFYAIVDGHVVFSFKMDQHIVKSV